MRSFFAVSSGEDRTEFSFRYGEELADVRREGRSGRFLQRVLKDGGTNLLRFCRSTACVVVLEPPFDVSPAFMTALMTAMTMAIPAPDALIVHTCDMTSFDTYRPLANALHSGVCGVLTLRVERAMLSDEQGELLAKAVASPTSRLRKLTLCANPVGQKTLSALCLALRTNTTLKELDLSRNTMGPRIELGIMLAYNNSLERLAMPDCPCDCPVSTAHSCDLDAMEALAAGLSLNCALKSLAVLVTHDAHAEMMMTALDLNYTLTQLDGVASSYPALVHRVAHEDRTHQRRVFSSFRRFYTDARQAAHAGAGVQAAVVAGEAEQVCA